jgi:DNA-binding CsgD family transcriptional regulator
VTVVVGVDGAGRSHRLRQLAATTDLPVIEVDGSGGDFSDQLSGAAPGSCLVLVDDAHELSTTALHTLTELARRGVAMVVTRRPTLDRPALAELDRIVAEQPAGPLPGGIEQLRPLSDDELATLLPASAHVTELRHRSAGHPVVAVQLASSPDLTPTPGLVAWVQQQLALLPAPTADLARVLALRLELPDAALVAAAELPEQQFATAFRQLRDHGLLVPGGEAMIPAVAEAIRSDLTPAERRRLWDAAAGALLAAGGDPVAAATALAAAHARTARAAEVYRAAADRLRFTDPATALHWYEDALEAGADPTTVAAGTAEVSALLGQPVDVDSSAELPASERTRVAMAGAATVAQQARTSRSADMLLAADPPGPALAVPALMATGRLEQARTAVTADAPAAVRRFAEAALTIGDPQAALPLLIEAAETVTATSVELVWPDTPHAVGAMVAVAAGDVGTAEHLLETATATQVGGPATTDRHQLLLAWARLRAGRYDTALAQLRRLSDATLPGRERLLLAALSAGVARRSGDIARLRQAWAQAEPALVRRTVDLLVAEPLEELLVAAARLRQHHHVAPVLELLDQQVAGLGAPLAWQVTTGWIRLQVAVATEDVAAAHQAAESLTEIAATPPTASQAGSSAAAGRRQQAQCRAAGYWARALAGEVDEAGVLAAAADLAEAQLPWEGSRLVGHAAIRVSDPAAARRLLERARELASTELSTGEERRDSPQSGLSEREREVAQLVLDGRTYREIGAQLYLSPKTVEHHIARIRTKLGATSRAELIASLRRVLGERVSDQGGGS